MSGGVGADMIDGGDGWDFLSYSTSEAGVTIALDGTAIGSGGDAAGDVITNIEEILGSNLDDISPETVKIIL